LKILILGTSGILGNYLFKYLQKKHEVKHTGLNSRILDFTKKKNLINILNNFNPNVVINCIAITNIDLAEKYKIKTRKINFELVKEILEYNKFKKFYFINFSTDHVYNNLSQSKNSEKNISFNKNFYSKTKILTDNLTKKYDFLSLRINFFGKSFKGKGTFSDWLYVNFKKNKEINLFIDQYISPLSLKSLSNIISKILYTKIYGIFNLGSKDQISKKNLAIKLFGYLSNKKKIKYNSVKVNKICKIKRSNYMGMNSKKFEKKFQIQLPNVNKEIKIVANEYRKIL